MRRSRGTRCCKWMLAATLRSCFGPCFKRFGNPSGYDSIEDSPEDLDSLSSCTGRHPPDSGTCNYSGLVRASDNWYESLERPGLDYTYRSKSTSEIFRSSDYYFAGPEFMKPDKRSFSASFGYLNDTHTFSLGMRSTLTSANDIRTDVSEAFWSCRGSISRSSTHQDSEQGFYSDESEEPHEEEFVVRPVCEGCGEAGKEHLFDDHDKCNWRERSINNSLPKSQKWVQLD